MKTYEYLYYKLFCIWLKKKDEITNAPFNAVISLSFLVCLNIASIPLLIMAIFGKDAITLPQLPEKWIIFLIIFAFGASQYFLIMHNKKYISIIERYKDESEGQRKKGLIFIWLYILITIGIPLYIFLFTTP